MQVAKNYSIEISDQITVAELKHKFSDLFPYLKIELFRKPHNQGELSAASDQIPQTQKIGMLIRNAVERNISLVPQRTVAEVESEFSNRFGLNVQVFRKSGSVWIETSLTDAWTLEAQNREGFELSRH